MGGKIGHGKDVGNPQVRKSYFKELYTKQKRYNKATGEK